MADINTTSRSAFGIPKTQSPQISPSAAEVKKESRVEANLPSRLLRPLLEGFPAKLPPSAIFASPNSFPQLENKDHDEGQHACLAQAVEVLDSSLDMLETHSRSATQSRVRARRLNADEILNRIAKISLPQSTKSIPENRSTTLPDESRRQHENVSALIKLERLLHDARQDSRSFSAQSATAIATLLTEAKRELLSMLGNRISPEQKFIPHELIGLVKLAKQRPPNGDSTEWPRHRTNVFAPTSDPVRLSLK